MNDFDVLLVTGAEWLLRGCLVWLGAVVLAAVLETATGGGLRCTRWVPCPGRWRRLLLAGLGLALTAGSPAPAAIGAGREPAPAPRLPVPARPLGVGPADRTVVVAPGDTLWAIACTRLGDRPSGRSRGRPDDREVAGYVARLHRVNRSVVGPDPDLIKPGQRLVLPVQEEAR